MPLALTAVSLKTLRPDDDNINNYAPFFGDMGPQNPGDKDKGTIFAPTYSINLQNETAETSLQQRDWNYIFRNIPHDCIHLIFSHLYFCFRLGRNDHVYLGDILSNEKIGTISEPGTSIKIPQTPDWKFLQKYAHCVKFAYKELESTGQSIPFRAFLHHCRHAEYKQTFHSMAFTFPEWGDVVLNSKSEELLRGVSNLDLPQNPFSGLIFEETSERIARITHNLREVETLCLNLNNDLIEASVFDSLRSVRNLILKDYNTNVPESALRVFQKLRNVKHLELRDCGLPLQFPVLQHTRGIQSLNISSKLVNLPEQSYFNLRGIRILVIHTLKGSFTNKIMEQLRGIEELELHITDAEDCKLNDAAFRNLRGIRKLSVSCPGICSNITDDAFKNLRGIQSLSLRWFPQITSAIFEQLRGIKELHIRECQNIIFSADTLRNLRGIELLEWGGINVNQWNDALRGARVAPMKQVKDECLEQLSGVKVLSLKDVVVLSRDVFYHLSHLTKLILCGRNIGAGWKQTFPLSDETFSHLKNIQQMYLHHLRLEVSNFADVIEEYMPRFQYLQVDKCRVLKTAMEGTDKKPFIHSTDGNCIFTSFMVERSETGTRGISTNTRRDLSGVPTAERLWLRTCTCSLFGEE